MRPLPRVSISNMVFASYITPIQRLHGRHLWRTHLISLLIWHFLLLPWLLTRTTCEWRNNYKNDISRSDMDTSHLSIFQTRWVRVMLTHYLLIASISPFTLLSSSGTTSECSMSSASFRFSEKLIILNSNGSRSQVSGELWRVCLSLLPCYALALTECFVLQSSGF